jgi:hypothetical protein
LDLYGVEVKQYLFLGPKKRVSLAKWTTMHRQFHVLIAFWALLGSQAIWFTASSLLGSLPKPPADEANLFKGVNASELRGGPYPSPTSTPPQPGIQQGALADGLNAQNEYFLWTKRRRATVESLNYWNGWVNPIHFLAPHEKRGNLPAINKGLVDYQELVDFVAWQDFVIRRTEYLNDLIQQLILPPLYGCIGAMAYVLRTLSQQAKDRLYRTENDTVWDLRISLRALAGLAIGWFFKPSGVEVTGIGLVSPFALAFVAGYSVDLLFTAMDRIVAAFSGPEAPLRPATQGQQPRAVQEQPQPPAQVQPKLATQEGAQN